MKILYTILLLVLIAASFIRPQWKTTVSDDNIISGAPSSQTNISMSTDGDEGAFIGWVDYRNSVATAHDIYIQRIDKDGFTIFPENGIPVCTANNNQESPHVVYTGDNASIILWTDDRTNNTNATDLYAQKVDADGNMLWSADGVPVSQINVATPGGVFFFDAVADGEGGAYIVWSKIYFGYFQLRGQRINSSGNILWDSAGVIITDGAVDSRNPRLVKHSSGVGLVFRHFGLGGYPIYFQMIDQNGNLKWTAPGKVVAAEGPQGYTSVAPADDTNGGVVAIAWSRGGSGLNGNVYAQLMNASGNKMWGDSGIVVNNVSGDNSEIKIVNDTITGDSSSYYLVWKDGRRINVAYDIYAQRLNNNGAAQWTQNGILVSSTPFTFTNTALALNDDGVYAAWADTRLNGSGIYVQRINRDNTFAWAVSGVYVSEWIGSLQMVNSGSSIIDGGAVLAFSAIDNGSGTGENVYAKYVGANGFLGGITSVENDLSINPDNFYLDQNYPNPFNPSTKIRYTIPNGVEVSIVQLKVYDVLGNEVSTLLNEEKAAGSYEITFNAASSIGGLASGIYFYRLQAGNFVETKKMILLR